MIRFRYFVRETWSNLSRNLTLTVAAIITVAVGVMLVGMSLTARYASGNALGRWEGGVQFEVFLQPDITGDQLDSVGSALLEHPEVERAEFVSQQEAYDFLSQRVDAPPLEGIDAVDLPASYRVVPTTANAQLIESLAAQVRQWPGVYAVDTGRAQIDAIRTWFTSFRWIVLLLSILLSAVSVVLIINSLQVAMVARRREIEVMKLVGATNGFIRTPFMLEGITHGIIGGVIGAVAVSFLRSHVEDLFTRDEVLAFFRNFVVTSGQFRTVVLATVGLGVLVGAIGSAVGANRFLDV